MLIRPYDNSDFPWLSEICVRTANAGQDATGLLKDDDLWPAMFLAPYLEYDPELAFVAVAGGRPVGYIVGADNTDDFEEWFRQEWWPRQSERWPHPAVIRSHQDGMVVYASSIGSTPSLLSGGYPAHLHVDLIPEGQGRGFGRLLVDALCRALLRRGAIGVHAVASAQNHGATAFYRRLGFEELSADARSRAFGLRLASTDIGHFRSTKGVD